MIDKVVNGGLYSNNSSDLYIKVFKVHKFNISKDKAKIKMGLFYKSTNAPVHGETKNYKLSVSRILLFWDKYDKR